MDASTRTALATQGYGRVMHDITRCSDCNYILSGLSEEDTLQDTGCPNCSRQGTPELFPTSYADVLDWVGQYAVLSASPRDHVAAVVLFCAWVESLLEALKETRVSVNPQLQQQIAGSELWEVPFKEIFGQAISALLDGAPDKALRKFWPRFTHLQLRRNEFLHGANEFALNQVDANEAIDLADVALEAYVWLNNQYCLRP